MLEPRIAVEELQREMHQRIYRLVMQLRFVLAPLPLFLGGFVIVTDPTLWRRITLIAVLLLALVLAAVIHWRTRHHYSLTLEVILLVVGLVFHPVILLATGGVMSPVLLAMLLVSFVASTLLASKTSAVLITLQTITLCVVSTLEYLQPFGSLVPRPYKLVMNAGPSPALLLVFTLVGALLFVAAREIGYRIQQAFSDMIARSYQAREQSLQLHREQLTELTQLTGEIAHELKNPLASVKGLAALLARRSGGPEPEPLVVLRREVDRMQGILEEFLNFSRPLVPLNQKTFDLYETTVEVVSLHEGLSALRGIDVIMVPAAPTVVYGDPRKVRQILVNLLQNALEATANDGHIVVRVTDENERVSVILEDDGKGIEPSVAGRVFEAGVTSKGDGSGLGLNVARGLARQHRGDVTLEARSPRGCTATLRLPRRPVVETSPSSHQSQTTPPTATVQGSESQ